MCALLLEEQPFSICEEMHSNDMAAVTSKLFPIFLPQADSFDRFQRNDSEISLCAHPDLSTTGAETQKQMQSQHAPPKSGLKRMSYPFSNLSTVVLATDIPVLPVEELRAETK